MTKPYPVSRATLRTFGTTAMKQWRRAVRSVARSFGLRRLSHALTQFDGLAVSPV